MTDPAIEEIYLIVEAALKNGQTAVPFHSFPYRYKNQKWSIKTSKWKSFWQELKPAYEIFEKSKHPPTISVEGGKYVIKPG